MQAVEPARLASAKPLHTTMIRNEAAYHGCVLQLLQAHPPPSPLTASFQQAIYLCGDSHCLPGLSPFSFGQPENPSSEKLPYTAKF
jgi:hypothetical protein